MLQLWAFRSCISETEAEDNAKEEHHDEVLAEFYEGDFFGGWVTNVGPSLYRAHKERHLPRSQS